MVHVLDEVIAVCVVIVAAVAFVATVESAMARDMLLDRLAKDREAQMYHAGQL